MPDSGPPGKSFVVEVPLVFSKEPVTPRCVVTLAVSSKEGDDEVQETLLQELQLVSHLKNYYFIE